ncbi:HVO_A0556 family zinc finger protein [Halomontanus rarus]|uniref:HVO_A0556 family zinc finger protein n=1 Tax=Halomontanus rarus TaxID=3034020 RepID=UPI0023E8591E|nr:HVO_A0556 family zinc finger protein [Halovivax sp. TS33]
MAQAETRVEIFLEALESRSCTYCDEGSLERSTYKGNEAIVCEECGAPEMQFW